MGERNGALVVAFGPIGMARGMLVHVDGGFCDIGAINTLEIGNIDFMFRDNMRCRVFQYQSDIVCGRDDFQDRLALACNVKLGGRK